MYQKRGKKLRRRHFQEKKQGAHAHTNQDPIEAGRVVTARPCQRHLCPAQEPSQAAGAVQRVIGQLHPPPSTRLAQERGKGANLNHLNPVVGQLQLLQAAQPFNNKLKFLTNSEIGIFLTAEHVSDPDSNCRAGCGSVFVFGIRLLKVELMYKNPLSPHIFHDFHLFLKMIPNKSSLFNKIGAYLIG